MVQLVPEQNKYINKYMKIYFFILFSYKENKFTSPKPWMKRTAMSHPIPWSAAMGTSRPNTELINIPTPKKYLAPYFFAKIPNGI